MAASGQTDRRRTRRQTRGTAMVEFLLIVPFLALILGLTFFFGWAIMHKQQAVTASRYAAWKRIETGAWPTEEELNERVFADSAEHVSLNGSHDDLRRTATELAIEAGSRNGPAGEYAEGLMVDQFPAGRRAQVSVGFDTDQRLYKRFTGDIHSSHGREGVTWRRDEVNPWPALRDHFYLDFDNEMRSLPAPAGGMAGAIRHLYMANWPAHTGTLD